MLAFNSTEVSVIRHKFKDKHVFLGLGPNLTCAVLKDNNVICNCIAKSFDKSNNTEVEHLVIQT